MPDLTPPLTPHGTPPPPAPVSVEIRDDMIRLGQFLKLTGIVEDGGQAREAIERGEVLVGGEVETRRGRQLHNGDVVELAQQRFVVTAPTTGQA
ncbi:MAG: RNA-binding S4 domain-containing protein [Actinomycetia bacterium]|nr:RNA-binding S4 domain-containing protein [Actinomycetes bacterium]